MVKLVLPEQLFLANEGGYTGLAALSNGSALLILSAAVWMHQYFNWIGVGADLTQAEMDEIDEIVSTMEAEVMASALGMIMPFATGSLPSYALPCDGSIHNRVDFPELYAVLDPVFIIDADTFITPDMTDRVNAGAGGLLAQGQTGGSTQFTLNVGNLPPHQHGYFAPSVAPLPTGGGAPIPTVTPTPQALQTTIVGSGDPITHVPPFLAMIWGIIAGI